MISLIQTSQTAKDVRAKFIIEGADYPTDPEADEVRNNILYIFQRKAQTCILCKMCSNCNDVAASFEFSM
jgi:hypothetical protein